MDRHRCVLSVLRWNGNLIRHTHTHAQNTAVETADFLLARGPFTILDDSEDAAVRVRLNGFRSFKSITHLPHYTTGAALRPGANLAREPAVCRPGRPRHRPVSAFYLPCANVCGRHPCASPRVLFLTACLGCHCSGLPLLVSNPDIVRPGYDRDPMPGMLGQAYERKGEGGWKGSAPSWLVYGNVLAGRTRRKVGAG